MLTINYNDNIFFNKETSNFTFEMSDMPNFEVQERFLLRRRSTGGKILFELVGRDMDGSDEDVYGYHYRSVSGAKFPCTLLVIND